MYTARSGGLVDEFRGRYLLDPERQAAVDDRVRRIFDSAVRSNEIRLGSAALDSAARELSHVYSELDDLLRFVELRRQVYAAAETTLETYAGMSSPISHDEVYRLRHELDDAIAKLIEHYDDLESSRGGRIFRGLASDAYAEGTGSIRSRIGRTIAANHENAGAQQAAIKAELERVRGQIARYRSLGQGLSDLLMEPHLRLSKAGAFEATVIGMSADGVTTGAMQGMVVATIPADELDFRTLCHILGGEGVVKELGEILPEGSKYSALHDSYAAVTARTSRAGQYLRGAVPMSPGMRWLNVAGALGEVALVAGFGWWALDGWFDNRERDELNYTDSEEFAAAQKAFDEQGRYEILALRAETLRVLDALNDLGAQF